MNKVTEWKAQCSSSQVANSVQEAENLLKKHHELSDDISQIYAEVILIIYFYMVRKKNYHIINKFYFFT